MPISSQVNVADFGARPDGRSDAAEAFARAFAAAAGRRGMTEVVVPAGAYRLDRPVVLPPRIAIRGVGLAAVTVPAGRQGAMFTANQPEHLVVRNLLFFGGDRAIDLVTEPSRESRILIDGCRFDKLDGTAITCKRGTGGMAGISNRTALLIDDCTFVNCRAVLDSDARQARMDHPWITTHRDAAGSGVIVNRGNFHLRWLLGVPRDVNQHWVDNDGRVLLDRCRCGGENGGLPMVRNLTAAGDVLLQNSWLCVSGSKAGTGKRITIVDCDEIPACIALRGNWSRPWPQMMVTIGPRATGSLEGRFFASGNASPLQVRDERRKPPGQERAETDIPGGALATVNVSVSEEQVDGLSKTMLLDFGREVFMEMLLVPPGEMLAGSPADEAGRRDDENRRPVCIATPFYLARTEVTQAVWERVMTADLLRDS